MLSTYERAIANAEAQEIHRLVLERLGAGVFDGVDLRVTVTDTGRAALIADGKTLYAIDPSYNEPIACARIDGRIQVGHVVQDRIAWGCAPALRITLNLN